MSVVVKKYEVLTTLHVDLIIDHTIKIVNKTTADVLHKSFDILFCFNLLRHKLCRKILSEIKINDFSLVKITQIVFYSPKIMCLLQSFAKIKHKLPTFLF
jgi:hypothetical protein